MRNTRYTVSQFNWKLLQIRIGPKENLNPQNDNDNDNYQRVLIRNSETNFEFQHKWCVQYVRKVAKEGKSCIF